MKNSHLNQLIRSLSAQERREARRFLDSPFFNQRTDVVSLYTFLLERPQLPKKKAWRLLFPREDYDDQKMRLIMSYLSRLLEQYLAVKEQATDEHGMHLQLARAYRRRGMDAAFDRTARQLQKKLTAQPMRDAHFYQLQYHLEWEQHQLASASDPTDVQGLEALTQTVNAAYLLRQLRNICLLVAHQTVYQAAKPIELEDAVVRLAEQTKAGDLPAIAIYLDCYYMHRHPEEEEHFRCFRDGLLQADELFPEEETRGLYLMLINYCVRKLNDGADNYFREVLELYETGLERGFLLENGTLSRFTYYNVVAAGLRVGDLDRVSDFIHQYKGALEKKYRESSFSFSLARLEYARRNFGAVLELLQKANYRDPLLNLAAKTLLLKTFYELDEYDLLQSHLDAMRNYLRRKRIIGYHRSNYLKIIRYTEKILRLNLSNAAEVATLRHEIEGETALTERDWLLNCL